MKLKIINTYLVVNIIFGFYSLVTDGYVNVYGLIIFIAVMGYGELLVEREIKVAAQSNRSTYEKK